MQIEIQRIYPPKNPGWSASIKGADGNYYGIKETMVAGLSEGQTITADIRTQEKNGKTYRDIIKLHGDAPAPDVKSAPAASTGRYGAQDDATAERIFVCGVVNAVAPKIYEKLGTIDSEKLSALVQVARVTWTETLGRKG